MAERIFIGDTAVLEADIFAETGLAPENPLSINWDLADPHGNRLILSSLPQTTIEGDTIILSQANGGFDQWDMVQWDGLNWNKVGEATSLLEDNKATFVVPALLTDIAGIYKSVVHFTLPNNFIRSQQINFEAIDALGPVVETNEDIAIDRAWMKLEDCFDSTLGGPWLRDKTKNFFNRDKMAKLAPDAIWRLNYTHLPVTSFTETTFDFASDGPIFSQSLLVETVYHLMRSYVEYPMPQGSPVTFLNRNDYVTRWKPILDQEEKKYMAWADTWKQQFFGFGSGAMLIGGYASTALRAPRALRTRLPRYYAGMYRRW